MGARADGKVARVHVDVALPHLDRLFDYEVPPELDEVARPGVRVRVRFAGRQVDGFLVERAEGSQHERLAPLTKVVSPEVVLPPESVRLVRAVADHYAGTFVDVARFAVPPRHATTEKAEPRPVPELPPPDPSGSPLAGYPTGAGWLAAVARGESPRAAWQVAPVADTVGDWADALAAAAAATVASGRSAVLLVPLSRDVDHLARAVARRVGKQLVARQTAELGPSARYRAFLRGLRGQARVVVGTRSAVLAPVADLGLVAVWDDGNDQHASPQAPYVHARDAAAIRVAQQGAAFLVAAHLRTAEVQAWVERGWLAPIALTPAETRRVAPAVRVAAERPDPDQAPRRLPHPVFEAIRAGLAQGPVLVHNPFTGYVTLLVCDRCRTAATCEACHGPLRLPAAGESPGCGWCGRLAVGWTCRHCEGRRLRSALVGASRTAEELGRAFPGVVVRQSSGGRVLDEVPDSPALVVATPGAEPAAEAGYAAAVLLDVTAALNRPDLRVAEECLRRWLAVTALVRPAADGGTVVAVGASDSRTVQALLRLDPAGFAARELADRRSAGYPPAVRLVVVEGEATAVDDAARAFEGAEGVEVLGPVEVGRRAPHPGADEVLWHRLLVRAPAAGAATLVGLIKAVQGVRSAKKDPRPLRVRLDPIAPEG